MGVGPPRPPPRSLPATDAPRAADVATDRVIDALKERVRVLEQRTPTRQTIRVDLALGINTVEHGLGRPVAGVHVTPTEASAGFAWALIESGNPHPERLVLIEVSGIPMLAAPVEVW
jgi:hypothetical protein